MEKLDPELKTYYMQVKDEVKKEHNAYISAHPEIRQLLNDFLSTLLLEKPEDVYDYAQDYFSFFNTEKEPVQYKPLVISGPSGVGKVIPSFMSRVIMYKGNLGSDAHKAFPRDF